MLKVKEIKLASNEQLVEELDRAIIEANNQLYMNKGFIPKKYGEYVIRLKGELLLRLDSSVKTYKNKQGDLFYIFEQTGDFKYSVYKSLESLETICEVCKKETFEECIEFCNKFGGGK